MDNEKCGCGGTLSEMWYGGSIGLPLATYRTCLKCKKPHKVADRDLVHDAR